MPFSATQGLPLGVRKRHKSFPRVAWNSAHQTASCKNNNNYSADANNDVTEDVLTAHLKSKDIHIFNVRTVSHKDSYRKSFRVVFKEADNTKLMKPEVWGEGITVREWVSNRE